MAAFDSDRNLLAIAAHTTPPDGWPLVAFTYALVETTADADEVVFVFGDEMARHIADHRPRKIARIDEAAAPASRDGRATVARRGREPRLAARS